MTALDEALALNEQLVTWRRFLHRHPELGFQEYHTAELVARILRDLGYTVQEKVAHTGVVGLLENGPGPVVMVRVDMDALPVQEANDIPYKSEVAGVMHACGHDAHVAIGLGVAQVMAESRTSWRGTLKLVFQPGEEGLNGAEVMVKEGVLTHPRPDAVLALHVWADLPANVVAVTPGPVMSAAERWQAVITGKGGHAAHPEQTIDPLVATAYIVTALQSVVARNVGAQQTAVVTVGTFHSGDAFNVIPHQAELSGTIRTFEAPVRETVLRRVREVVAGTAQAMGAQSELTMESISPAVVNDPAITATVQAAARAVLGEAGLHVGLRTMGSEDAAFFLREIPGCYFFVGGRPEDRDPAPHHNPYFDINERALPVGVAVTVEALRRLLPAAMD